MYRYECSRFIESQEFHIWLVPLIIILVLWSLFWKGTSLWHAARRKEGAWFVILLLFNTLGILDMIYLFGFLKLKADKLFK